MLQKSCGHNLDEVTEDVVLPWQSIIILGKQTPWTSVMDPQSLLWSTISVQIGLLMDTWTSTKTKISSASSHPVVPGKHLSISHCRFCLCLLIFSSRLPIFKISSFQSFLLIFNIFSQHCIMYTNKCSVCFNVPRSCTLWTLYPYIRRRLFKWREYIYLMKRLR